MYLVANGSQSWPMAETHIAVGQEPRAELHVVFQVEGTACLEPHAKCGHVGRLGELLHTPDAAKLLLRVLGDG